MSARCSRVLGEEFSGIELTGVDIEQAQLDAARSHLAQGDIQATLVRADAVALPFSDGAFDHVWMMWFVEHLTDPLEVGCGRRAACWRPAA